MVYKGQSQDIQKYDWTNVGQDQCRAGLTKDRKMQDRKNAGQEKRRTGKKWDRTNVGQKKRRTEIMQDRKTQNRTNEDRTIVG